MQQNVNNLIGNIVQGTDGEMGKVEEFYFDDQAWIIVYLIVKAGNWLSGREVLISPYALIKGVRRPGKFLVNLTKEQIKNSPDIDTDLPVSRQHEMALHQYYPWQSYWGTGFYEGGIWGIVTPRVVDPSQVKLPIGNSHLRSTHAITGYHIETTDGKLGHLRDFIVDGETWHIEYLVVEMHSWLMGKRVLIARRQIKEILWDTSKVLIDVTSTVLESLPEFEESAFLHPETSDKVFDHELH